MSKVFCIFLLSLVSYANAADLCDDGSLWSEEVKLIQNALQAPSIKARFELNKECEFDVQTTAVVSSNKSLKDFMEQILDPAVNKASANSNLISYSVTKKGATFEQKVVASKSIMTATIINTCKYTNQSDSSISYECNLKDGDGVLQKNKTITTCINSGANLKKCTFKTSGLAIKQFFKSPCTLAGGGAAETVNGVQRLMEYVTYGSVDSKKWEKPGKAFYGAVSNPGDLKSKSFIYEQQIQ